MLKNRTRVIISLLGLLMLIWIVCYGLWLFFVAIPMPSDEEIIHAIRTRPDNTGMFMQDPSTVVDYRITRIQPARKVGLIGNISPMIVWLQKLDHNGRVVEQGILPIEILAPDYTFSLGMFRSKIAIDDNMRRNYSASELKLIQNLLDQSKK